MTKRIKEKIDMADLRHNPQACIDDALTTASQICTEKGARLTPLRQKVLRLIWQSDKPLSAYTLIEQLSQAWQKTVAPPTIYRSLDFLLHLGLIHRIHSLNAYIGCHRPEADNQKEPHTHYVLVCKQCRHTQECIDATLPTHINEACHSVGFTPDQQWLEVTGLCSTCQVLDTRAD